jgi:hypothetical protein
MSAQNLSHLNRAITHGADNGLFVLPKGPSGKVKLAPKTSSTKEVNVISFFFLSFSFGLDCFIDKMIIIELQAHACQICIQVDHEGGKARR